MTRTAVLLLLLLVSAAPISTLAQAPAEPPPVEATEPAEPAVVQPPAGVSNETIEDGRRWGGPVLRVGSDYTLRPGEDARDVLVVGGNASIGGSVRQDVVIVFGTVTVAGTAFVEGSLVVVGGHVSIEPGARVQGDFVSLGGTVDAPPEFNPEGQHIVVAPEAIGGRLDAVLPWVTRGLLLGRPIVPDLPWVWSIVVLAFAVYLTLTLLFERPVRACATTLSRRPLTSILVGLIVLLLIGPVLLLLTVSIIGVVVVPFLLCALLAAWVIGKVGVTRWIGHSMAPESDEGAPAVSRIRALRSFVIGSAVLIVAYMIPALGLITWATVGVLGLGSALLSVLSGYRRENPATPRATPVAHVPPPGASMPLPEPTIGPAAFHALHPEEPPMREDHVRQSTVPASTMARPYAQPAASDLLVRPRAAFKDRLAAFVLDVIVVLLTAQLLVLNQGPRVIILLLIAYHVFFWTLKATTIGGIICQLRVVRVSGEPLRFVDSFVRAFSAIFSLGAAGLGGLWIIKDPDRQAWHDKIAGTYVVKVPREYPL